MENRNEQEVDDRLSAVYNNVKLLYEEAKLMWKGVLFEIQLDPLDPESVEQSMRHTIDFRHCLPNEDDDDRHLTLEELFREIERLNDYKSLLDSALEAIDLIREEHKDTYQVTFLRILQPSQAEQQHEVEIESESEEELESDEEFEPEWEEEWLTDSGNGSVSQYSQVASEYDSNWASDSGLQTESESDIDLEPEWELHLSFEEDHEFEPEHQLALFAGLSSDTDSDVEVSTSGATCNDSEDEEEANLGAVL